MGSITPEQYQVMLTRLEGNKLRAGGVPDDAIEDEVQELHYPILNWCKKQIPEVPYIWSRTDKAATIGKGVLTSQLLYRARHTSSNAKARGAPLARAGCVED
jgi:hypothetical protein